MSTKYILVGGYPKKALDGGKAFTEELIKGFKEPVKILECLFARPRDNWDEAFNQDKDFFINNLPGKRLEFQLADPEKFREQVAWADAIYIRGGASEAVLLELQKQSEGWEKELPGKTLAGSSAGAHAISKYYYGLDDLKIGEGLGLLSLKIIVHYGSDYNAPNIDWNKAEIELKQYKEDLPLIKLAEGQFKTEVR
ncbi:MAG: Type 1 glutamine amidotransferase-like domain-containing protein [Candidatus Paceibacterota bacterium]|jgi:peptidase E